MKKVFVLLLVIIFNVSAYCQIGVTSAVAPVKVKKTEVVVFDSTKNFLGDYKVMSYIDQTLFVLPKAKSLQKYGYSKFYKICEFNLERYDHYNWKHYGQDADAAEYHTRYEDLAMTYWHVDSIVSARDYGRDRRYLFYLSNVNKPESKCAFSYDPIDESGFPFIVLSHYNYLKEKYIGKQFIVRRELLYDYDLSTGDSIIVTYVTKTVWTAEDLNVISNENGEQNFGMILKQGNKRTFVDIDKFEEKIGSGIIEKNESDKLVATYGLDMVETAFHGKLKVGMSRELLILAWGKPLSIKNASYGDEYVYGPDSVCLKNGKVTEWYLWP